MSGVTVEQAFRNLADFHDCQKEMWLIAAQSAVTRCERHAYEERAMIAEDRAAEWRRRAAGADSTAATGVMQ